MELDDIFASKWMMFWDADKHLEIYACTCISMSMLFWVFSGNHDLYILHVGEFPFLQIQLPQCKWTCKLVALAVVASTELELVIPCAPRRFHGWPVGSILINVHVCLFTDARRRLRQVQKSMEIPGHWQPEVCCCLHAICWLVVWMYLLVIGIMVCSDWC